MSTRSIAASGIAAGLILALATCTNPYDPAQRAVGGGLLGAGAGAAIGGAVGGGHGAAVGAAIGGATGALTGAATTPPPPPPPPPQGQYVPGFGYPPAGYGQPAPGYGYPPRATRSRRRATAIRPRVTRSRRRATGIRRRPRRPTILPTEPTPHGFPLRFDGLRVVSEAVRLGHWSPRKILERLSNPSQPGTDLFALRIWSADTFQTQAQSALGERLVARLSALRY